ncbi:MAG: M28 family metallopeptidase, partial [Terriglobales bacterium]
EPNVICVLPGELPAEIVVGAHFDHADLGEGVVDNWSGASLLPDLLESLKAIPRRHTFVFVGFTAEERGLRGSEYYAQHLTPEQLKGIEAMINIDSVGMTPTKVWVSHSDPRLVTLLGHVAKEMKLPVSGVNVENVGSADSESFAKRHVPVITFHSVTQEKLRVLHSAQDNMRAISLPDYYATYKLVAAYLAACDVLLPIPPPPASGKASR